MCDMNCNMESDPYGNSKGCTISFTGQLGLKLLAETREKHYVQNNMLSDHRGSVVVPLGPLNSGGSGNITRIIKVDGNNKLGILSDPSEYSTLSQLNQDMLGRRHSVDSNIGRTRQPTFVRTYREVKWKRVNMSTKFPPVSGALAVEKFRAADSNDSVVESREYITGTHIIRQRVPIFKTNGDPPSKVGRRFSAGDLIPVTGLDLNMAPNGKCLVIRDILPNNLSNATSDDSIFSRKGSTSSSEDISESQQVAENADSFNEFFLIDEDDEDGETTDDGTDEDDEEGPESKALLFENTAIECTLRPGLSSNFLYSFSAPAIMSSPLTMANGTTRHLDLRRLVLKNSMQMKQVITQPNVTCDTGTFVSDSPAEETAHEVMKSALIEQTLSPCTQAEILTSSTMQSVAKSVLTETDRASLPTRRASTSVLAHSIIEPLRNETVMSPSVTQPVLMSDKTLQAQSHEHTIHTDASEDKLDMPVSPSLAIDQPVPAETSWVLTSTIANANVYVSCFNSRNSKFRVRKAHWASPHLTRGTIPIDKEEVKAICVELVVVPATSGGEPLRFQRITYSSGYIYRSTHWVAPFKNQISHTAFSCQNNVPALSVHLCTSIPHVSPSLSKKINHFNVDKTGEMQTSSSILGHPLRIHSLPVNIGRKIYVQGHSSASGKDDLILPIPVTGTSSSIEAKWKDAERNVYGVTNYQDPCFCPNSGVSPSVPLIMTSMTLQRPLMSTGVLGSHLSTNTCDGNPLPVKAYSSISSTKERSITKEEECSEIMARVPTASGHSQYKPVPFLTTELQALSGGTLGRGSRYSIYTNSGTSHMEQTPHSMQLMMATQLPQEYNSLNKLSSATEIQPSFAVSIKEPHISSGNNPLRSSDPTIVQQAGQVSSQTLQCSDQFLSDNNNHTRPTDMSTSVKTKAGSFIDSDGFIQSILSSIYDNEKKANTRRCKG